MSRSSAKTSTVRRFFSSRGVPAPISEPKNQAEIECADVNQLPLEDVLVSAQMSSPHSSGIVTMREAPLDQLASLAQQTLAVVPR